MDSLLFREQSSAMVLSDTLLNVAEAKFRAEIDPDVGKETWLRLDGISDVHHQFTDLEVAVLRKAVTHRSLPKSIKDVLSSLQWPTTDPPAWPAKPIE
jgi:hypothetical protein